MWNSDKHDKKELTKVQSFWLGQQVKPTTSLFFATHFKQNRSTQEHNLFFLI